MKIEVANVSISWEELVKYLDYCPNTGIFNNKVTRSN